MPYPTGHRTEVRKNIIQSARKLFNRYGFENVSVQQIMAGAGLTHGGFYSYFKRKVTSTPKCWDASSRTRNGRTAGRACTSIFPPPT